MDGALSKFPKERLDRCRFDLNGLFRKVVLHSLKVCFFCGFACPCLQLFVESARQFFLFRVDSTGESIPRVDLKERCGVLILKAHYFLSFPTCFD